jgi:hypothetical protein
MCRAIAMPCQARDRDMTDDKTKTDPGNAGPISLTKAYELAYGTRKFSDSDQHRQAAAARCFGDGPRPTSSGW